MFTNRKRVILDRGPSWPDYKAADFIKDIQEFGNRERRFGKING